ncbi:MAG TPA: hypothetical protein VLU73_16915 [Methylococcaceae bacterium]|nr:hypothetical protein [Methylococcaceae bacterium]
MFNTEFLEELGDVAVDVLGTIVAVEALDGGGKGIDQSLQYRQQEALTDLRRGKDCLELTDLVHCVGQVKV